MNEPFYLQLTYQGNELELKARFERWGYTYRITVLLGEESYVFEADEEGGYRALSTNAGVKAGKTDPGLLRAVAERLRELGDLA